VQWLVDGNVHLTEICTTAKWHLKTCITGLMAAGLSEPDAKRFAVWAFGTDAVYQRAIGDESLSVEDYARLSITSSAPAEHSAGPPI